MPELLIKGEVARPTDAADNKALFRLQATR